MDRGFSSLSGCYPAQRGIKNSSCGVNMVLWSAFKPCFFSSEWEHFRSYRIISRTCTVQKVSFTLYTLTAGHYFHMHHDRVQAADKLAYLLNAISLLFSKQNRLPHVQHCQYRCIQSLQRGNTTALFMGCGKMFPCKQPFAQLQRSRF